MIDLIFHPHSLNSVILKLLPSNLDGIKILDCGCGIGEWGFLMRTRLKGRPILYGIDRKAKYIDKIEKLNIYDALFVDDVLNIDKIFPKNHFHIILAIEVLEHLEKKDGYIFLKKIEKVCSGRIILSTPNGYLKCVTHKCGWNESELKSLGYKTFRIPYTRLPRTLLFVNELRRIFLGVKNQLIIGVKHL